MGTISEHYSMTEWLFHVPDGPARANPTSRPAWKERTDENRIRND
jgi:hypothetical protein